MAAEEEQKPRVPFIEHRPCPHPGRALCLPRLLVSPTSPAEESEAETEAIGTRSLCQKVAGFHFSLSGL